MALIMKDSPMDAMGDTGKDTTTVACSEPAQPARRGSRSELANRLAHGVGRRPRRR